MLKTSLFKDYSVSTNVYLLITWIYLEYNIFKYYLELSLSSVIIA